MKIRNLLEDDLNAVKVFTDRWIGEGYYTLDQLQDIYQKSQAQKLNCSFVALDGNDIDAVRLTYAPGKWWQGTKSISPALWDVRPSAVAYFKSLFVSDQYQGKGLGKILSQQSMDIVKQMGGMAIICHSWLESPNNSSQKYLEKMNFKEVKKWHNFWKEIDYSCTRCGRPCLCTASEMIHYL